MSHEESHYWVIDRAMVTGEELVNFPVFLRLEDGQWRTSGAEGVRPPLDLRFYDEDGVTPLAAEIRSYDPIVGRVEAWVRFPRLTSRRDTQFWVRHGGDAPTSPPDPTVAWDDVYCLVLHDPDAPLTVSLQEAPGWSDALTVEAWVDDREARAEALQSLVSQWTPRAAFDAFDAYDAGETNGMDTSGFFGAVFDGRYITFSPQHDREDRHGKVLRYDTHGAFHEPSSWSGYDASGTEGLVTKGYYGAVFTGSHIYFCPRRDPGAFHSRMLRYNCSSDFRDPASWEAHDLGLVRSSQSAAFDGRYIYFCPGQEARAATETERPTSGDSPQVTGMSADQVLTASGLIVRHDTHGAFKEPGSWSAYDATGTDALETRDFDGAVFDGRYVYFVPLSHQALLRYDTHGDFVAAGSWAAYDLRGLGAKRFVGAVFDGTHLYLAPYGDCPVAIRFDTRRDFRQPSSWESYELRRTSGLDALGFDGAFFDGRFIYYVPYWDEGSNFHGVVLRYDTQGAFTEPASWRCRDAGLTGGLKTVGFNGGATDGRYLYFAAWRDETGFPDRIVGNGRVLRYDTLGEESAFSLRYCDLGHNGGLCAALPGARFLVNTDRGAISVAANRRPEPGRHHLAGVYDGRRIRLYIDGELVNEQPATGTICDSRQPIAIGRILGGLGQFAGEISEVRISNVARSADWIRTQYRNLRDPSAFCRRQATPSER